MRRTQVTIDEATYTRLRKRAHREGRSIAAVIREMLRRGVGDGAERRARAVRWTSAGVGRSGHGRISEEHDEVLASKEA